MYKRVGFLYKRVMYFGVKVEFSFICAKSIF